MPQFDTSDWLQQLRQLKSTASTRTRSNWQLLQSSRAWSEMRKLAERQRLSLVLMIGGLGLLIYVGSEYLAMYREQQTLHREWDRQQHSVASAAIGSAAVPVKDDGLTRVLIQKINLDVILVEGTSHKALRLGPGHLKNTPTPGEIGNAVISAHRDTFFRHIYELEKGDEIQVRRQGHTYTFEVTGKKIVDPDDTSVVKNTPDPRLTLITCYPTYYVGPAPKRLVVVARLVPGEQQRAEKQIKVPARQGS
jgi:LPXTG-site transpeptidase (sortase) family protein